MPGYRIISSDDHVMEPPDLWTSRIEPKFRDRAPRVVRMEDGCDWWCCEGYQINGAFSATQTGLRFEEPEKLQLGGVEATYENVPPGGCIPDEHVKDMDIDGINVSILYTTDALILYSVPDGQLLTSIFTTYNDWIAEFCSAHPKRLKGIAMLNIDDVEMGIKGDGALREDGSCGSPDPCVSPRGEAIRFAGVRAPVGGG